MAPMVGTSFVFGFFFSFLPLFSFKKCVVPSPCDTYFREKQIEKYSFDTGTQREGA